MTITAKNYVAQAQAGLRESDFRRIGSDWNPLADDGDALLRKLGGI